MRRGSITKYMKTAEAWKSKIILYRNLLLTLDEIPPGYKKLKSMSVSLIKLQRTGRDIHARSSPTLWTAGVTPAVSHIEIGTT